jgi:WD40 repeat protein
MQLIECVFTFLFPFRSPDLNLLASGSVAGEIKLWDAINRVCIHVFVSISIPNFSIITAIHFCPGDNIQCYVTTQGGQMIRIVRNEMMEFTANILEVPSLGEFAMVAFPPCVTCFAAIWYTRSKSKWELALFDDSIPMSKTQSVFLSGGRDEFHAIAMSPDCKKLATTNSSGGTRIFECHDLTIQKYAIEQGLDDGRVDDVEYLPMPIVFDPTSQLFAVGCSDGRVELNAAT